MPRTSKRMGYDSYITHLTDRHNQDSVVRCSECGVSSDDAEMGEPREVYDCDYGKQYIFTCTECEETDED